MISQSLFDETLLENQDVFDYTDDQAVKETINEFEQSSRLEHISLTHPSSPQGKLDRDLQTRFVACFVGTEGDNNFSQKIELATSILAGLQARGKEEAKQNQSARDRAL